MTAYSSRRISSDPLPYFASPAAGIMHGSRHRTGYEAFHTGRIWEHAPRPKFDINSPNPILMAFREFCKDEVDPGGVQRAAERWVMELGDPWAQDDETARCFDVNYEIPHHHGERQLYEAHARKVLERIANFRR